MSGTDSWNRMARRYDLAKVGRYKFNKKLSFKYRLNGQVLADTPSHVPTVLFETGDPNISVRLDCLDNEATDGEALIIRAQIAWLSAEMLQDIQARLAAAARRKGFWFQR